MARQVGAQCKTLLGKCIGLLFRNVVAAVIAGLPLSDENRFAPFTPFDESLIYRRRRANIDTFD